MKENIQDSNRPWQNPKRFGLKKQKAKSQESVIIIDGELCHYELAIANEFNSFFKNVAAKLVDELPLPKALSAQTLIVFVSLKKEKVYVKTASSYYQSMNNLLT